MSPRFLLLPALLFLAACEEKNTFAPPPPVPVGVVPPIVRDQQTYMEFSGRIEALQVVELRARVAGTLEKVSDDFKPGLRVEAGTLLFEIDKAPYEADLKATEAAILRAQANITISQATRDARKDAGKGVSKIQVIEAEASLKEANANLAAAEADRDNAQINLDYCTITAPISGRISELYVDQFNLVGTGEPTLLCTIVKDDAMHVYFEADERASLRFLRNRKGYEEEGITPPQATLTMADGETYEHPAQIELADNRLDAETGTLRIRAEVPNPDGKLSEGFFVRLKVPKPEINKNAILVPTIALQQDLGGYFVLTVGEGNKVVRKNITLGDRVDRLRIVQSGLTGDEQVITVGLQRVREGVVVAPSEAQPTEADTPPAPPPSAPPVAE